MVPTTRRVSATCAPAACLAALRSASRPMRMRAARWAAGRSGQLVDSQVDRRALSADLVGDDPQRGGGICCRTVDGVLQPGELAQCEDVVVHEPLCGVQRGAQGVDRWSGRSPWWPATGRRLQLHDLCVQCRQGVPDPGQILDHSVMQFTGDPASLGRGRLDREVDHRLPLPLVVGDPAGQPECQRHQQQSEHGNRGEHHWHDPPVSAFSSACSRSVGKYVSTRIRTALGVVGPDVHLEALAEAAVEHVLGLVQVGDVGVDAAAVERGRGRRDPAGSAGRSAAGRRSRGSRRLPTRP